MCDNPEIAKEKGYRLDIQEIQMVCPVADLKERSYNIIKSQLKLKPAIYDLNICELETYDIPAKQKNFTTPKL